jgi:transposase, IS30 family
MSQVECITKKREFKHLTETERKTIERNYKKLSISAIAEILGRDKSTISREIKRASVIEHKVNKYISKDPNCPISIEKLVYYAEEGARNYDENRKRCGRKSKIGKCESLIRYVIRKVKSKKKRSIDSAIGHAKEKNYFPGQYVSTKTFYNWIDKGLIEGINNFDLLHKIGMKPRNKSKSKERKRIYGRSIEERPISVKDRVEFGHWEGDLIIGKDNKSYLCSLVERKTRIGLLFKISSKESKNIVEIIDRLKAEYGDNFSKIFKTITFDNGSEFADSIGMEKDNRTNVYYAHPYSSYERGSNENWNGLVRRFLPKGSSFEELSEEAINKILNYINTMPRKLFKYKTAMDLWEEEINAIYSV